MSSNTLLDDLAKSIASINQSIHPIRQLLFKQAEIYNNTISSCMKSLEQAFVSPEFQKNMRAFQKALYSFEISMRKQQRLDRQARRRHRHAFTLNGKHGYKSPGSGRRK